MKTPEAGKLDLVMRDSDFVIYYDQSPLTTPGGSEIAHYDSRLLKHILIKLSLSGQTDYQSISSFTIFSFCKDFGVLHLEVGEKYEKAMGYSCLVRLLPA